MNILFINSIDKNVWGGGEKWMLLSAIGLQKRNHSIFFAGQKDSIFLNHARENNFPIFPLHIKSDFGLLNILKLAKVLKNSNINVIIPNFNKDVRIAGIAKKLAGSQLLIARNGLPILQNKFIYKLTYTRLVDGMITNTEEIKNRYLKYGWLKPDFINVIYNGIDTSVKIDYDADTLLKKYKLPIQKPIIGIFGRLTGQKQHHLFLQVAKIILKINPDTIFIIVGGGPLKAQIEKQIIDMKMENNIYMLGMQHQVVELYSICSIILLTSSKEGLPNVVMESMLSKKPVVAFNVGGIKELIPSDEFGFSVVPDDIEAMSSKTLELLNSKTLRQSIGQNARKRIIENFSTENMINKIEKLLINKLSDFTSN